MCVYDNIQNCPTLDWLTAALRYSAPARTPPEVFPEAFLILYPVIRDGLNGFSSVPHTVGAAARILLAHLLKVLPAKRWAVLIADREFVRKEQPRA